MDVLSWDERPGNLRDPVMIAAFAGWNDAGASATGAVGFLAERLGARRVAAIDPDEFFDYQSTRPLIDLSDPPGTAIVWPEVELRIASPADGAHDLVLVSGSEPSFRWRAFCRAILDAAGTLGVRRLITVGSLLADVVHTHPVRLTAMATDPALVEGLGGRAPSYAGPTGIIGVLHQAAAARGLEAASLWAPVSHYAAGIANSKGSLALVQALEHIAGLRVDTGQLRTAAAVFEGQVSRAVEAEPRLRNLVEQLEQAARENPEAEHGPLPTGDQLAAELERYLRERDEPA